MRKLNRNGVAAPVHGGARANARRPSNAEKGLPPPGRVVSARLAADLWDRLKAHLAAMPGRPMAAAIAEALDTYLRLQAVSKQDPQKYLEIRDLLFKEEHGARSDTD